MTVAVSTLAAGAAVALATAEWLRQNHEHRVRRVVAVVAAVATLAMLWPSGTGRRSGTATAIVVTPGAEVGTVRHLADSAHAGVYLLPGVTDPARFGDRAISVPTVSLVGRRFPEAVRMIVTGWGLERPDLDAAATAGARFVPAPMPTGIATLDWPRTIQLGDQLTVRGVANAPIGTRVFLDAPSGLTDSSVTGADSTFALSDRPHAAARLEYTLRLLHGRNFIAAETIGVSVAHRPPPRLLVLDGQPDFESRYLKDWISHEGGAIAVRTEISRNRYRTIAVNLPAGPLAPIDNTLLSQFDVVLLDDAAAGQLTAPERVALSRAIREQGLGLVLRSGAQPSRGLAELYGGITLRTAGAVPRATRLTWGDGVASRAVLVAPFALALSGAAQPLVRDSAGTTVTAWRPAGAGAVAVTLVATPSRWQLAGERERFAAYWSLVVGRVARGTAERWSIVDAGPPLVDQPVALRRSGTNGSPAATIEAPDGTRDSIFLAQDPLDPETWAATYWPRLSGWYRVLGDSAELDFDARPPDAWRTLGAELRRRHTFERLGSAGETAGIPTNAPWRVPAPILFLVFLGAVTVLWVERP